MPYTLDQLRKNAGSWAQAVGGDEKEIAEIKKFFEVLLTGPKGQDALKLVNALVEAKVELQEILNSLWGNDGNLEAVQNEFSEEPEEEEEVPEPSRPTATPGLTLEELRKQLNPASHWVLAYCGRGVPVEFVNTVVAHVPQNQRKQVLEAATKLATDPQHGARNKAAMQNDPERSAVQILKMLAQRAAAGAPTPAPAPAATPAAAPAPAPAAVAPAVTTPAAQPAAEEPTEEAEEARPARGGFFGRFRAPQVQLNRKQVGTLLGAIGVFAVVAILIVMVAVNPLGIKLPTPSTPAPSVSEAQPPPAPAQPEVQKLAPVDPTTVVSNLSVVSTKKSIQGYTTPCAQAKEQGIKPSGPTLAPSIEYLGAPLPTDSNCWVIGPGDQSWAAYYDFTNQVFNQPQSKGSKSAPAIANLIRAIQITDQKIVTASQARSVRPPIFSRGMTVVEWLFIATIFLFLPITIGLDIKSRRQIGVSDWAITGLFTFLSVAVALFAKEPESYRVTGILMFLATLGVALMYLDKSLVPVGAYLIGQGVIAMFPDLSVYVKGFALPSTAGVGLQILLEPQLMPSILFVFGLLTLLAESFIIIRDREVTAIGILTLVALGISRFVIVENVQQIEGTEAKTVVSFLITLAIVLTASAYIIIRKSTPAEEQVGQASAIDRVARFFAQSVASPNYLLVAVSGLLISLTWFPPQ